MPAVCPWIVGDATNLLHAEVVLTGSRCARILTAESS
jgi:hypothetical protein